MLAVAVMIRDKYAVRLAPEQREELQNLIRVGKSSARVIARARVLLKSNDGWAAPKVAEALDVSVHLVIERPPIYCLCLGYVEGKDLFYGMSRYDDIDPSHIHAPNLSGSFGYLCGHDAFLLCSLAGKDCREWS